MAQLGSARRSGRRGRRFKSCHPDHRSLKVQAYSPAPHFAGTALGLVDTPHRTTIIRTFLIRWASYSMSLMPPPSGPLHVMPRNLRRAKGILQTSRVQVTGDGPNAVLRALTTSLQGRHDHDERLWIRRIETFRNFRLQSPEPFTMVDYGAGTRADPTRGTVATATSSTWLGVSLLTGDCYVPGDR